MGLQSKIGPYVRGEGLASHKLSLYPGQVSAGLHEQGSIIYRDNPAVMVNVYSHCHRAIQAVLSEEKT